MAITTATIDESSYTNTVHHANMDKNDLNMHHPIGFRSASVGSSLFKDGTGNYSYEVLHLPPALDYVDSSAAAPTETSGDIYILDDSTPVLVVTDTDWTTGNSVKYTFSGSPDLSGYSTVNNIAYIYGCTNSENNGRFVITAIDNSLKTITVTNTLVSDATLDETTITASAELPHSSFDGASNNDVVKFDGTDWYRITPVEGTKIYDKTLNQFRTYNGSLWLGDAKELIIAVGDESTAHTVTTALTTFRMPHKMYLSEVRASLTVAGTTSGVTTFDINETATSILSTKLSIDYSEKTSTTAATAAVISDATLADDAEITIDCDVISGGGTEAGGKIYLIGNCI